MDMNRRTVIRGATAVAAFGIAEGTAGAAFAGTSSSDRSSSTSSAYSLAFDSTAWSYDSANDVYYQTGKVYVTDPAAPDIENLSIYVPGAYLTATANDDGTTYTATVDPKGTVGDYSGRTAPIVIPVNTPGYAAQKPATSYSYSSVSQYLTAGHIYVWPGLRGRDTSTGTRSDAAPWGVTDLKAAVRFLRYNRSVLPGSTDDIVLFGMSGGGAQDTVAGASGDSPLYHPYLRTIGAAMADAQGRPLSDTVAGVMAWCPITSLHEANLSYEWNMGQFASTGTRASGTWTSAYSADLAKAWPRYVNRLGLRDEHGRRLTLTESGSGTYLAGSYYDHLIEVITTSLNNFLSDNTFPYTITTMGGPPGSGQPGSSTTYETVDDYIAYLNTADTWVTYDATTNTATVSGLEGFVNSQKNANKPVGAFDGYSRGQTENGVFAMGLNAPAHFAPLTRDVVKANEATYAGYSDWSSDYGSPAYDSDFAKRDSVGKDMAWRGDAYNPLYYLSPAFDGYRRSQVARHWRIRTGIMQGDTANTTEINIRLALQNYGIRDVDFATVWAQGHTMAERTGDSTTNFISWVASITRK
ncbi:alpha/beta hydrolase [Streptomyces fuscichromogenes]|uniref:Alpha/beta hydrolase n=2 Tax=Streptomyces fuscichromogenes TaxID=1324013 RepID=A0A917UK30_9ACTN|nr:alpha/beta hydrolase [Streptomyces fuscichromogenes]